MLDAIGASSMESLFSDIPDHLKLGRELETPGPLEEADLVQSLKTMLDKNVTTRNATCFIGGGVYDYYVPALVDMTLSRGELYSAYTSYQPETSQGMLQMLFEYQSMMAAILGVSVVNASLYDWATAAGEAVLMAARLTRREKIAYAMSTAPDRRTVIDTYIEGPKLTAVGIGYDEKSGRLDIEALKALKLEEFAAVYVETPNYFGVIEDDIREIVDIVQEKGCMLIVGVDTLSCSFLEPPGEYGADLVVGEGQTMGNFLNCGGPMLGVLGFQFNKKKIRQLPGRLVGITPEKSSGRLGYGLVLSTREQHIRREKATSNICSNEALAAVAASTYMAAIGPRGLEQRGLAATSNAHYLAEKIAALDGYELAFNGQFFREFTVKCPADPAKLVDEAVEAGFLLSNRVSQATGDPTHIAIGVDHIQKKKDLDALVEFLAKWRSANV